jgi:hypothetical protein
VQFLIDIIVISGQTTNVQGRYGLAYLVPIMKEPFVPGLVSAATNQPKIYRKIEV